MKTKLYLSTAFVSLLLAGAAWASETAAVRMFCLSIEVDQGTDEFADTFSLNFAARPESVGELGPFWPVGPSYYDITLPVASGYTSSLYLYDSFYGRTYTGGMNIDLPVSTNANNRFPDFFDVSKSVNTNMPGAGGYLVYPSSSTTEYGTIDATWTRAAGSYQGTYAWAFNNYSGPLPNNWFGTFQGTFKILEYTGTITYTPGASTVSASVNLVQTGVPANTRSGTIQFTKVASDRFNSLTNQPGIWTNSSSQIYNFTNHYFFRDPNYPTNYSGYLEYDDDGDLTTVYPYAIWIMAINDTNDANHNGIPDFSDDPTSTPLPRRPQISLAQGTSNLLLTVHGDINHVHQVQQVTSIKSTNWQNVVSVTLTNDPQVIPLSRPSGPTFWRVTAQ